MKPSKYPKEAYIVFYRGETGIIELIDYATNLRVINNKILYNISNTTDKNNSKYTIGDPVSLRLDGENYKIVKNPVEARTIKTLYFKGVNNA